MLENRGETCQLLDGGVSLLQGSTTLVKLDLADHPSGVAVVDATDGLTLRGSIDYRCLMGAAPGLSALTLQTPTGEIPVGGEKIPSIANTCAHWSLLADMPRDSRDSGRGPYSKLDASIEPSSVESIEGKLHYIVRLSNVSDKDFTFDACPNYKQTVFSSPSAVTHSEYGLACAGVNIAAGGSQTFEMVADVPHRQSGSLKLGWYMTDGPSDVISVSL